MEGIRRKSAQRKHGEEWAIKLQIDRIERVEPSVPLVRIYCASPKGDRVEWMVDQLSQCGAVGWSPLITERTVVEPRAAKLDRLERIAIESMKQCGRAWMMAIGETKGLDRAISECERDSLAVTVADVSGEAGWPFRERVGLFVGPEGGWSAQELAMLTEVSGRTGGGVVKLSPHVLRIETAATVGVAMCMSR